MHLYKSQLGSTQAFQNLKRRLVSSIEEGSLFRPKKYTSLLKLDEEESGVLAPRRLNYVELFKDFTQSVVPSMEKQIELELMKHQFKSITNQTVKESILHAYLKRLTIMRGLEISKKNIKANREQGPTHQLLIRPDLYIETPLATAGQMEMGMFAKFPLTELKKYFLHDAPGDYKNNHIKYSRTFAVLLTEEGIKLMKILRNSLRNDAIFLQIINQDQSKLKENVYEEVTFQQLFATLRGDLWECLEKHRKDEAMHRLFVNSPVFDSIISMIISELSQNVELLKSFAQKDERKKIFESLANQIKEKMDHEQPNSHLPLLFQKTVKSLQIGSQFVDLTKYAETPYIIPENLKEQQFPDYVNCGNSLFMYGDQGTGKSGFILQTAMWGHKSGWVVITVPSGHKWTQSSTGEYGKIERHHDTGLFIQPKLALEFLQQISEANKELFAKIPVNLDLWGKFNISGVHDNDIEPVPNTYDPIRKYNFNDHQKFLYKEELAGYATQSQEYKVRLCHKLLPKPQFLSEIVEAALQNPLFITSAIYEIMEQLYKQDKTPVLVAVDGANWFYRPSGYPSFRYESNKQLEGFIPPYHLSLCRLFMHLDGHKIRNGYKIMATQIYPLFKHVFTPKMIHLPENYCVENKGIPLDHYRKFCQYSIVNKFWMSDDYTRAMVPQFWMETQGNLGQTLYCMRMNWRDLH